MRSPTRPHRAFWGDVRFLVGVGVVLLSVAGVWLALGSARHSDTLLQTTRTILPGEPLTSADFRVVDVSVGAVADGYLTPADLDPGLVATRTLDVGELLPAAATAAGESLRTTTVVIESSIGIPAKISPGTRVELWYAPPLPDDNRFDAPRLLLPEAIVSAIPESEGLLSQTAGTLELVIDRSDVAAVLAAVTDGSSLSAVPLGAGE